MAELAASTAVLFVVLGAARDRAVRVHDRPAGTRGHQNDGTAGIYLRPLKVRFVITYPSDSYMRALAEALYALSYLERLVLGDAARLTSPPPELSVEALSWKPTGTVARVVRAAAVRTADAAEHAWLDAAADALDDVVPKRNAVVHAHPATFDGEQILYRWAAATPTKANEAMPITERVLTDLRDLTYVHIGRLNAVRLPPRS